MSKKDNLYRWLKQEAADAHGAETFSRNGEDTAFDDGVFVGRETLADEIIKIIDNGCKFETKNGKMEPVMK